MDFPHGHLLARLRGSEAALVDIESRTTRLGFVTENFDSDVDDPAVIEGDSSSANHPHNSAMMTSAQLRLIALTATGAVLLPAVGLAAGAMVPLAMSNFGTVVAGVGTFHAPLVSGGCAAILQASSAALVSGGGAVVGGIAGASVGALSSNNQ